ncbi:MAG: PLP-dependent aminotransferase family protein [Methylotenera sp.]
MLRPWELKVEIERQSGTAIHVQIAQKIIADIQSGRFTPGVALPGTRDLASKIQVNRKTVIQAYDELIAQGWLTSEHKRGTFVSSRVLAVNHRSHKTQAPVPHPTYQAKHELTHKKSPILNAVSTLNKRQMHDTIHFSDGLPDARLIPFEILSRAMRHALITSARKNKYCYGDPKGVLILREALLQMLNMERGLHAKLDNICITRGSQMAIFLVAKVFVQTSDYVVLEKLTNQLAREAFISCGASILNVEHDDEGLNTEHLAQLCTQHKIRAVYVTPHHQIPTTVSISPSRRQQLIALAAQYNFMIIEDDSDHEFNFSNHNTLPLASMQNAHHVVYIGSLSKALSPNFRLGYIVAPTEIISQCANQISLIDRQGDQITELAVAELLHLGEIKKQNLRTHKIYSERRTYIADLINKELSEFVSFKLPHSGLALWLEVCPTIDMSKLLRDTKFAKVTVSTGATFSNIGEHISAIRLGFANLNNDEISIGIMRLRAAFLNQQAKRLSA